MNMVDLSSLYDEPLDPAAIDFTAVPGRSCRNFLYQRQRVSICNKAVEIALKADLPSCDKENVIYVPVERDERQLTIGE